MKGVKREFFGCSQKCLKDNKPVVLLFLYQSCVPISLVLFPRSSLFSAMKAGDGKNDSLRQVFQVTCQRCKAVFPKGTHIHELTYEYACIACSTLRFTGAIIYYVER